MKEYILNLLKFLLLIQDMVVYLHILFLMEFINFLLDIKFVKSFILIGFLLVKNFMQVIRTLLLLIMVHQVLLIPILILIKVLYLLLSIYIPNINLIMKVFKLDLFFRMTMPFMVELGSISLLTKILLNLIMLLQMQKKQM